MQQLDNRLTLKTIETALVEARSQVALTATWRDLHTGYGVGAIKGKKLFLSAADRTLLRELVMRHSNIDLLAGAGASIKHLGSNDRTTLSQQIPNEKLSGLPVAADMVLVGTASGELVLLGNTIRLPPGMVISCHYSQLHGLDRVVLVENLAPMYVLDDYLWPGDTGESVMLFRGSPQHSPAAVSNALKGVGSIICFPDYDPQGLRNSFTEHANLGGVIVPCESTTDQLLAAGLNKPDLFSKQEDARRWLDINRGELGYVTDLLARRIALSQEAMIRCELGLL
ncbi:DUF7281 domain-containing protein [Halopseudomonas sp.]|jgi:hypothetical protein|uniref:DUF7281 domain-containing protein n=1 Tax=Halopseudomonas sp. TaxID=2901191 RepID=UPI0030017D6F